MSVSPAVEEAWHVNSTMNRMLLKHLTPAMLDARTPVLGDTVAQLLAHMTGTVKFWGTQGDKARLEACADLALPGAGARSTDADLERIREALTRTAEAALEAAQRATGKGALLHSSLDAYLIHMMVHDAHHRGQIMLALRAAGHPLPDEETFWGPWWGERRMKDR